MRLPDIGRSRAVLIGSSAFQSAELPDLPAVRNNVQGLASLLVDRVLGSFDPQHCLVMADPVGLREVYSTLRKHFTGAQDTLLIYYGGHGLKSPRNDLYLTLSDTDPDELATTGLSFDNLRELLLTTSATNKVLILDCCFSGSVIPSMTSPGAIAGQLAVAGAYTLASVPANAVALAPEGAPYTAFTGELLALLYSGVPDGPELLTLGDLYPRLASTMKSRGLPQPERQGTGTVERLGLVRNRAHTARAVPVSPPPDPAEGGTEQPSGFGQPPGSPTGLEFFYAVEAKAQDRAAEIVADAERTAGSLRTAGEREAAEVRVQARREADLLRGEAERETKAVRVATAHEVAELKAVVEREVATLRAVAEREITQLRAKAAREVEEKRSEAAKMLADARIKRDEDLESLALELADRREKAEREESTRHAAQVAVIKGLVDEAEKRARTAEGRAKEIEARAEARRIESERIATELLEKAKAAAEKAVDAAKEEAHRLVREAREEADITTGAARREVEALTSQKDSITGQLTWIRGLLDDFRPTDQKIEPTAADQPSGAS